MAVSIIIPLLTVLYSHSVSATNCVKWSCSNFIKCHFNQYFVICPIAIAYSMGQIIKSVCVCQCVSLSVRLRALSRLHFLIDFHQNWHRRKYPQKEERVR